LKQTCNNSRTNKKIMNPSSAPLPGKGLLKSSGIGWGWVPDETCIGKGWGWGQMGHCECQACAIVDLATALVLLAGIWNVWTTHDRMERTWKDWF
jgi:hypothetical protein